jgi:hypothetical protein
MAGIEHAIETIIKSCSPFSHLSALKDRIVMYQNTQIEAVSSIGSGKELKISPDALQRTGSELRHELGKTIGDCEGAVVEVFDLFMDLFEDELERTVFGGLDELRSTIESTLTHDHLTYLGEADLHPSLQQHL